MQNRSSYSIKLNQMLKRQAFHKVKFHSLSIVILITYIHSSLFLSGKVFAWKDSKARRACQSYVYLPLNN